MEHSYLTGFMLAMLKETFRNEFHIGAALNPAPFCESNAAVLKTAPAKPAAPAAPR